MSDRLQLKVLDYAKFLLILGVILIHSNPTEGIPDGFPDPAYTIVNFISGNLCSACVPSFFIISGFLFFLNIPSAGSGFSSVYRNKMLRRSHTLLIPYLLWNAIGSALFLLKAGMLGFPGYDVLPGSGLDLLAFIRGFWNLTNGYPYDFVLWFIRNLMVFCLLTPLFFIVARSSLLSAISLIACLAIGIDLWGGLYFLIGSWLAFHQETLRTLLRQQFRTLIIGLLLWFGFAALIGFGPEPGAFHMPAILLRNIGGTLSFFAAGSLAMDSTRCRKAIAYLIPSTFFIYAFHGLFSSVTRKLWLKTIGYSDSVELVGVYILTFLTLVIVSWAVWLCASRLLPRFTAVLTGNR